MRIIMHTIPDWFKVCNLVRSGAEGSGLRALVSPWRGGVHGFTGVQTCRLGVWELRVEGLGCFWNFGFRVLAKLGFVHFSICAVSWNPCHDCYKYN